MHRSITSLDRIDVAEQEVWAGSVFVCCSYAAYGKKLWWKREIDDLIINRFWFVWKYGFFLKRKLISSDCLGFCYRWNYFVQYGNFNVLTFGLDSATKSTTPRDDNSNVMSQKYTTLVVHITRGSSLQLYSLYLSQYPNHIVYARASQLLI